MTPEQVIQTLGLHPLPGEGGYFLETYRSSSAVTSVEVAGGRLENRVSGTAIYYLVTQSAFSALHRLPQDEVYHFYSGRPVEIFVIHTDGRHEVILLGNDLLSGHRPQFVVPGGSWQGTRLRKGEDGFALLGTTVAPGFEFEDMELAPRQQLISAYPEKKELIERYTNS